MAERRDTGPLKLCLAASGGGHVRQLLDLEPVWGTRPHVIVTEDTALGRSLAADGRPVRFVPHYALGQARLGAKGAMVKGALANMRASWRIVAEERPDVVISTGAGATFWTCLFARMRGAKFVLVESFARFDAPSKFGRIASPIATRRIVQSPALKAFWPDAELFDPLRMLDGPRPAKQPLLFATVGATLPFPRLTDSVLALKRAGLAEDVLIQAGEGAAAIPAPDGTRIVESLGFGEIQATLSRADIVVSHGGTGSLITALRAGCRVVAMPRLFERGEHYDNHQAEIVDAFVARGLIERAEDADGLAAAIARLRTREPAMATTDPQGLIGWLNRFLDEVVAKRA